MERCRRVVPAQRTPRNTLRSPQVTCHGNTLKLLERKNERVIPEECVATIGKILGSNKRADTAHCTAGRRSGLLSEDCEKDSRRVLGLELISDPRNEGIASGVFPCIARGWNQGNGNEMCASTLPCRLREFLQVERVPIRVSIPSAIDVVRNMRVTDEPLVGNHLFFRPVAIQLLDEGE